MNTTRTIAKDIYGAESYWVTLKVAMPRNKVATNKMAIETIKMVLI